MAGMLPKNPEIFHAIPNAKVAIIAAMWHSQYVDAMIDRTLVELSQVGITPSSVCVHKLPGSLELPYAARCLFEAQPDLDAIIAFGVVLKGATTHNDSVVSSVVDGFNRVMDRFNKPIINEVIGVDSLEDAALRADNSLSNKGVEAVFALSELLHWKATL